VTVATKLAKRQPRIKGVCAAADELGISRFHLALVIRGVRISPKLLARYRDLKTNQKIQK